MQIRTSVVDITPLKIIPWRFRLVQIRTSVVAVSFSKSLFSRFRLVQIRTSVVEMQCFHCGAEVLD